MGFAVMVLAVSPAQDQTAKQEAVGGRARPDFESYGLSMGHFYARRHASSSERFASSFELFARTEVEYGHTDNLFRTTNDRSGSGYLRIQPALALRSDWDLHALNFALKGKSTRYGSISSEDTDDITARLDGRFDFGELKKLTGEARLSKSHEERGNDSDPGPNAEPLTFDRLDLGATYTNQGNDALSLSAKLDWTARRYDDKNGISYESLDRDVLLIESKVGLAPGGVVDYYLQPALQIVDYKQSAATDFDSVLYSGAMGATLRESDVSQLDGHVGLQFRDFADASLNDEFGLLLSLNALWNITPLTTFSGKASIANEDSQVDGATSKTRSGFELRADYEPFDPLIFGVSFAFNRQAYDGIERTDDLYRYKFDAKYLINEYLYVGADMQYEDQSSDVASQEYDETQIMFRIGAKLCCLTEQGVVNAFQ